MTESIEVLFLLLPLFLSSSAMYIILMIKEHQGTASTHTNIRQSLKYIKESKSSKYY